MLGGSMRARVRAGDYLKFRRPFSLGLSCGKFFWDDIFEISADPAVDGFAASALLIHAFRE